MRKNFAHHLNTRVQEVPHDLRKESARKVAGAVVWDFLHTSINTLRSRLALMFNDFMMLMFTIPLTLKVRDVIEENERRFMTGRVVGYYDGL